MKKIKKYLGIFVALSAFFSCRPGDPSGPGSPKDFRFVCDALSWDAQCTTPNTRSLTWIASGDDGEDGQALQYDLRWAYEQMSDSVFQNAYQFINEPMPQPSGTREAIFLPRMYPRVPMSFGLKAYDEVARDSILVSTGMVALDFLSTPLGMDVASQPSFGTVVKLLGDFNGMGVSDLAVGAPNAIEPLSSEARGAVFIYFNKSEGYLLTSQNGLLRSAEKLNPSAVIYGEADGDQFGFAIAEDGDFNHDGFADLVVGAPTAGKVYIFFGGSAGKTKFSTMAVNPSAPVTVNASDADVIISSPILGFGTSVALLGDMDSRGGSELIVGSPLESRVYIFLSGFFTDNRIKGATPQTVVLPAGTCSLPAEGCADWTLIGPAGSNFGAETARLGDVNGDGYEDMAIGVPALASIYIFYGGAFSGKALDFSLRGPQTRDLSAGASWDLMIFGEGGSEFGSAITARRDLSNASYGTSSVVISAPATDKVYVFFGSPGGTITYPTALNDMHDAILDGADMTFKTEEPPLGYRFGESVSDICDLNGDGLSDIMVGAPSAVSSSGKVGAVYLFYSGSDKSRNRTIAQADYVLWGNGVDGEFGASIACIGEVVTHPNIIYNTYFDDLVVGAPGENSAFAKF